MEKCDKCNQEINQSKLVTEQREPVGPAGPRSYPCVCSDCGCETTVPFPPKKEWPVYCRDCYHKRGDDHGR